LIFQKRTLKFTTRGDRALEEQDIRERYEGMLFIFINLFFVTFGKEPQGVV